MPFQNIEINKIEPVDMFTGHFMTKVTKILNGVNLKHNGPPKVVTEFHDRVE